MATVSSTITLVDQMSSRLANIQGNVESVAGALESLSGQQSAIDNFSWNTFLSNAEKAGKRMTEIGEKMTLAITGPSILLGKKLYGNAVDYESAFAGVKKTTEATQEEYNALYEDLLQISETNPTGFIDAAGIMEMAGQIGVAKEELTGFTKAYIGLQESTNISGEQGAEDLAKFLNVTEKTTANIDRIGGVIVALGNNFATTEAETLAMATRMGSTADLAGFSAPEILAFSAALSSVGINAEAGGSAAGKLMKQMQLAAEVGGTAQEKLAAAGYEYENALDFVNALSSMKSGDKAGIADTLGITVDTLQSLGDSWYLMEQFSSVMGISGDEFLKGWDESSAQSMLKFFQGLGNLDPEAGNSVLAQLAEMDLTEIRLSNLVAALAGNPELIQRALDVAYKQYNMDPGSNAMAEEVAKRYETQESQNAMLSNKLNNSMADLGGNLVEALQPALETVNQLLDKFNQLSETDQSNLITAFAVFAAGGPIVTAVGATVEAVGKIGHAISAIKTKLTGGGLTSLLTNPATWGIAAGAGLLLLIDYLDSIPSKMEAVAAGAKDIPITIDEASYQEALSKIAEVQAALEGLKAGEIRPEYENTSAAVVHGLGTEDMFRTALSYEAMKANANINQLASEYVEKMTDAQDRISEAIGRGDTAAAEAAKNEYEGLRTAFDGELATLKATYSSRISDLFNGMAAQYPEAASALVNAAADYDLAASLAKVTSFDWNAYGDEMAAEAAHTNLMHDFLTKAFNAGYMKDSGFINLDTILSAFDSGQLNGSLWIDTISDAVSESMHNNMQAVSDNPVLSTWLGSILSDPGLSENLDLSSLSGIMEAVVKTLDFKNACQQAGENPAEWGAYLSEGLAQGIDGSAGVPAASGSAMGQGTINAIKSALGVASPSTFMIAAGMEVSNGLAMGIEAGMGVAMAVASSMASGVVSAVMGILSSGTGFGIGSNFGAGIAAGISSSVGAVTAAASSLASAAVSAVSSALQIHSPSRVTQWQGQMTGQGFALGLEQQKSNIVRTVGNVLGNVQDSWNAGVWSMISSFAQTEKQALQDEMNGVEDGVKISDSDIKKIRNLAEREVINHFTSPSFNIEMSPTVYAQNDMDVDGIITRLEDQITERLEACADGVYT